MKKNQLPCIAIVCALMLSCNNAENNNTANDTMAVSAMDTSKTVTTAMEDPDPADSIPAASYGINSSRIETGAIVRNALLEMNKADLAKNIIDSLSRKFIFFEYDLNNDSTKEIFVGLTGPYFCGTGGCTFLLLDNTGKMITTFTVSDYPVIIDNNKTNGWKNLIVLSNGKNHLLKFDGNTYPSNPSVQPVFKMIPGDELPRALNYLNEPYAWFRF